MLNTLKQFLFIDQTTDQISHSKFWSNVGYAVMCFTFTYAVINGTEVDESIWMWFGSITIGNRTLKKVLQK